MTEAQPVVRKVLLEQDHNLLESLYRDLWNDVYRFVLARFGAGPPDPEEVAQAAFERMAKVSPLASVKQPRWFLFTIAANIVRDHRRHAAIHAGVHYDLALRNNNLGLSEVTPERVLESKERLLALKAALMRMPKLRRRVFLFVRVEGYEVAEAAKHFRMSKGTVYKHISRAMHDCMNALDETSGSDRET